MVRMKRNKRYKLQKYGIKIVREAHQRNKKKKTKSNDMKSTETMNTSAIPLHRRNTTSAWRRRCVLQHGNRKTEKHRKARNKKSVQIRRTRACVYLAKRKHSFASNHAPLATGGWINTMAPRSIWSWSDHALGYLPFASMER